MQLHKDFYITLFKYSQKKKLERVLPELRVQL